MEDPDIYPSNAKINSEANEDLKKIRFFAEKHLCSLYRKSPKKKLFESPKGE